MMAMWVRMRKCEGVRVKNYKDYITTTIQKTIQTIEVFSVKCVSE